MSRKKIGIILVVIILLGAGGYGGYVVYMQSKNAKAAGIPVAEETVGRETIITKVTSKGEVALLNTELIYASLVAEVDDVLVEKNDIVTVGQPVIRYRQKTRENLERDIKRARLDVQSAEVALNSSSIPPSETAIERAKLDVENANKAVERAISDVTDMDTEIARQTDKVNDIKTDLASSEILFNAGAISKNEIEATRRTLKDAEAALETLVSSRSAKEKDVDTQQENLKYLETVYEDTVNKLSETSTQNNIKQQQISLEKARLALSQLEHELQDFQQEILSPISGTVTKVNVSQGEITPTDKVLLEIADVSDYIIKVDVNERNATKIEIGQDVELSGAVLSDVTLMGKVTKIGYIAETKQNNSGTERVVPVEITVDKGPGSEVLKPGFSIDATIITSVKENAIAIPILSTLTESDGGNFVFVIKDDDTLERRSVKLGAYADMSVEVEGLKDGEKIVAQPTLTMEDGTHVTVTNRETEENEAGGEENDA